MDRLEKEYAQVLVLFAFSIPLILVLLILVIDFGGLAMAYHKGQIAADSAAIAAVQALDYQHFLDTNQLILDRNRAVSLAGQTASKNSDKQIQILGVYVDDDRVWVRARVSYKSIFSQYLGKGFYQIDLISSAIPAFGINEIGQ